MARPHPVLVLGRRRIDVRAIVGSEVSKSDQLLLNHAVDADDDRAVPSHRHLACRLEEDVEIQADVATAVRRPRVVTHRIREGRDRGAGDDGDVHPGAFYVPFVPPVEIEADPLERVDETVEQFPDAVVGLVLDPKVRIRHTERSGRTAVISLPESGAVPTRRLAPGDAVPVRPPRRPGDF